MYINIYHGINLCVASRAKSSHAEQVSEFGFSRSSGTKFRNSCSEMGTVRLPNLEVSGLRLSTGNWKMFNWKKTSIN